MSEPIKAAITELQSRIDKLENDAKRLKESVNVLCEQESIAPIYADITKATESEARLRIQPDTFHGMHLGKAARLYLEMRKSAGNGPATIEGIYEAVRDGGYEFEQKTRSSRIQGLSISLGKSTHTFKRLPNGHYGLVSWYGRGGRSRRTKGPGRRDQAGGDEGQQAPEESPNGSDELGDEDQ